MKDRLLLIGLDGAEPSLVFEAFRADLPNLRRLMEEGAWGRLESCHPPETVPSWLSILTGRDPGELGVYGPLDRGGRDYHRPSAPGKGPGKAPAQPRTSFPFIWQALERHGLRGAALGAPVPMEAGPDDARKDPERLLSEIRASSRERFEAARRLVGAGDWDLLVVVDGSVDRMHQGLYRFFDRDHPRYRPGSPLGRALHDHYVEVDGEIGRLLDAAGDPPAMVVSARGARRLLGGVRINDWLLARRYLKLFVPPAPSAELHPEEVDWEATRAWGEGGIAGRVYLNVKGREPRGAVAEEEYDALREGIAAGLEAMEDDEGRPLGTTVHRPERIYRALRNVAPDLLVYFGGLAWRSVGSFGSGGVLTREEDLGPGDACPTREGMFIYRGPEVGLAARGRERAGGTIYDIAPTVLRRFGVPAEELRGRPLIG